MSRFGNLEFGSGQDHAPKPAVLLQDEARFLALAGQAFENGRFEEALRGYAKVLEFNSKAPQAWTGQVRSLIELGEFSEARVWADKALASFPDEPELLAAKAVALARLGDLQGALSFSDAAVESQSSTPYIWLSRGDVLLARREKRAEYCFEKAFTIARDNPIVLWLAARIQAFYQHFAQALKLALQALNLEPARAVFWLDAGRCQMELGLLTQARNSFEQARELDPGCAAQTHINETAAKGWLDKMAGRWRQWFQR